MTPLPKGTKNIIPTGNIQGIRYINTFQVHPIYKRDQTYEMAFCAELCGTSWIRRAIKQHVLQSKELKCSISGQHELMSMAKFIRCICWKTVLEGSELHHFCLGTELSPPLWMLPSMYLKAVPNKLRYHHVAVKESNVFPLISAILALLF